MSQEPRITAAQRHGNLFITVRGDLSLEAARDLVAEIAARDVGRGNIFIDTEQMSKVTESGRDLLRTLVAGPLAGRLYFIGKPGFALASEGSRVIVRKPRKARCNGCRKCSCSDRALKLNRGGEGFFQADS